MHDGQKRGETALTRPDLVAQLLAGLIARAKGAADRNRITSLSGGARQAIGPGVAGPGDAGFFGAPLLVTTRMILPV